MKTERITLLSTREFKAFLQTEAAKENVSVSELVRRRCERTPTEDEMVLADLTVQLHESVAEAKKSMSEGLEAVESVLAELQRNKIKQEEPGLAA